MSINNSEVYNLGVTTMRRNEDGTVEVTTPQWVQDARRHDFHNRRNYDLTNKSDLRLLSFSDTTGFSQVGSKHRGKGGRGYSNRGKFKGYSNRGKFNEDRKRGRGRGRGRGKQSDDTSKSKDGSIVNRFSALGASDKR